MDTKFYKLKELIDESKNIVFFGGAGVSTESGLLDFRSKEGLYNLESKYNLPYEIMLSHSYYTNHKETFYEFYKDFMIKDVKPNACHNFLAKLEKQGKNITIITQNIDGLHQAAGSKNVIELHGSIHQNYCENCARFYDLDYIKRSQGIPKCNICHHDIKPNVVLYEEGLDERVMTKTMIALNNADLLIVAGTSLKVYPAAAFINYFYGDNIVIINKEKLDLNRKIKLEIQNQIAQTFDAIDKI